MNYNMRRLSEIVTKHGEVSGLTIVKKNKSLEGGVEVINDVTVNEVNDGFFNIKGQGSMNFADVERVIIPQEHMDAFERSMMAMLDKINEYAEARRDFSGLNDAIDILEKEFGVWDTTVENVWTPVNK